MKNSKSIVLAVFAPWPTLLGWVLWWFAFPKKTGTLNDFGIDFVLLDPVSLTFSTLIAWIGTFVAAYAWRNSLGDPKRARFLSALMFTLWSAQGLALSGNLGVLMTFWILTGIGLHGLLEHYRERVAARVVAWEKFMISRLGDLFLIAAAVLLFPIFGHLNFLEMAQRASQFSSGELSAAAILIVLGGLAKSAQVPFHAWLPRTLEAPTAVSALLHAGIVNAGGFLLVRCFPIVQTSSVALILAISVGTLSALWGSFSMIVQSDVKRRLAWSTVSQMGFMMLEIGLGWPFLALVHIVGHGLYKALSFLRSGEYRAHLLPTTPTSPQRERGAAVLGLIFGFVLVVAAWFQNSAHVPLAAIFAANVLVLFVLCRRKKISTVFVLVTASVTAGVSIFLLPSLAPFWGISERTSSEAERIFAAIAVGAFWAYAVLLTWAPHAFRWRWFRQFYARALYGFALTRTIEETVDQLRPSRSVPHRKGVSYENSL